MECHFQIFVDDQWIECATLTVRPERYPQGNARSVFEYDLDYAFGATLEPVSLGLPVDAVHHNVEQWPAFFYDLIPQGSGRKYLLGQLNLRDGPNADFPLVCAGAFNPIGRVRVVEAVEYFDKHVDRHDAHGMDRGFTLAEIIERGEGFHEQMMIHSMLAAGSTGVQGAAPKYLLTKDGNGLWHADGVLPDAQATSHFIVKRPRGASEADKKVLRNEAAYMDVARAMGIRTHGKLELHGDSLFIPRFDREVVDGKVVRLHQESAASLAGVVGFDASPTQFDLLKAIRASVTNKTTETIEFLKRDVLNLAMRNTDNHARNTAVQKVHSEVRLTPLFDFAPMYLDPEGIARAARWYHPETKKEIHEWRYVINELQLDEGETALICISLKEFGEKLSLLDGFLRNAGADDDVVDFLRPSIDVQLRQLSMIGGVE